MMKKILLITTAAMMLSTSLWAAPVKVPKISKLTIKTEKGPKNITMKNVTLTPYKNQSGDGFWFTYPVNDKSTKGITGVGFLDNSGKLTAFVPLENDYCDCLFNPSGTVVIFDCGTSNLRSSQIYTFPQLQKLDSLETVSSPIWCDDTRFAYCLAGSQKRDNDSEVPNWISLYLYDISAKKSTVLKAATKTEDFLLDAVKKGEISFERRWVISESDWKVFEKIHSERGSIKVPSGK